MMSTKLDDNATSSGGLDSPQETTSLDRQGSSVGSNDDPKTTGVPVQASVGTHVGAQLCARLETENGKQIGGKGMETQAQTVEVLTAGATKPANTINITTLGEDEFLKMFNNYVASMNAFANRTRNVHKELKETLEKTVVPKNTAHTASAEKSTQSPCWWDATGCPHEELYVRKTERSGRADNGVGASNQPEGPTQLDAPRADPQG